MEEPESEAEVSEMAEPSSFQTVMSQQQQVTVLMEEPESEAVHAEKAESLKSLAEK